MKSTGILILFFFLTTGTVLGQKPFPWPPSGEDNVDYFLNSKTKPKENGLHYRTYQNGLPYYAGKFKDGKPEPLSDMYYYDFERERRVTTVHHFGENPEEVTAENFFPSGKIKAEGRYIRQKKEGPWTFYDTEGWTKTIEEFHLDSLHGVSKLFYPSGKQLRQTNYNNGTAEGEFVEWYEDGRIQKKGNYLHDILHGKYVQNFPSGNKEVQGQYTNGLMHGIWIIFLQDGNIELTSKYVNGSKSWEKWENGTFREEYDSGLTKAEFMYEDGKKNGPFTEWYDQGEWIREPYDDPKGLGYQFREVLIGTQVEREGDYIDDKLDGPVTYYNEHGLITKTEHYENGEIESIDEK